MLQRTDRDFVVNAQDLMSLCGGHWSRVWKGPREARKARWKVLSAASGAYRVLSVARKVHIELLLLASDIIADRVIISVVDTHRSLKKRSGFLKWRSNS